MFVGVSEVIEEGFQAAWLHLQFASFGYLSPEDFG